MGVNEHSLRANEGGGCRSDNQVRLLQALGIKSTVITDGNTPINLFNTAHGLIEYGPQ